MAVSSIQHRIAIGQYFHTAQMKSQKHDEEEFCGCSRRSPKYFASLWLTQLYIWKVSQLSLQLKIEYLDKCYQSVCDIQNRTKSREFYKDQSALNYRCSFYAVIWFIQAVAYQMFKANIQL